VRSNASAASSETPEAIIGTGIAVAQYPGGVPWGDEPARLVIGLAAKSEEHIPILARLAAVLEDAALCERLATTSDLMDIHRALTTDPAPAETDGLEVGEDDAGITIRIANPSGLHARPAAEIVELLLDFDADITIVAGERRANAASITQLIALGASVGDTVTIRSAGEDAETASAAVLRVLLGDSDQR
jgi:phosphocarrier protein FPr